MSVAATVRSALYVPGNRPELFAKALAGPADVMLLDLEDAVPVADKLRARAAVANWLRSLPSASTPLGGRRIWVRVNPGAPGLADIAAVAGPWVDEICLAKTESAAQVGAVAAALDALGERAAGIRLCPLLETAGAIFAAREIARAPRVGRLQLGEADLCADIGMEPGPDGHELLAVRTQVVLAAAAAGIAPPLAPVSTDFRDPDALRESTAALARLGFRGRTCIHPAQVPVVNAVFTPTDDELERAAALVSRFDAASGGVILDDNGRMVDLAIIRHARRLLDHPR